MTNCPWVRIVNGINKYAKETSEEIHVASVGERSTGKPVAKLWPRQTSNLTLSLVSGKFEKSCLEVSKLMIRLLRHDDSICREESGAVRFEDLTSIFRSRKWVYLALANSDMDKLLAKRRRFKEKVPVLLESQFTWTFSIPSSNSRPFWRRSCWSRTARQRTVARWLHRAHLSRWELSRLTLHHPVWVDFV